MNNSKKPFIGIPFTNEKYLFSIKKINNNLKKKDNESIFDILYDILLEEFI
jgi:hypothetical protein